MLHQGRFFSSRARPPGVVYEYGKETYVDLDSEVMTAILLMADDPSAEDGAIAGQLAAHGFDVLRAELLVAFVPLGVGRAVIARLPADPPISWSERALIQDSDRVLEIILTDVPEFVAARELGEKAFQTEGISQTHFRAAGGRSAELAVIDEALKAGDSLDGGDLAPPILLRLADAPGFKAWYRGIKSKKETLSR